MNILKALKRSTLGLDLYMWLVYRTFTLREPVTLRWRDLYRQRTQVERTGRQWEVPADWRRA